MIRWIENMVDSYGFEKHVITRTWSQIPYLTRRTLYGSRFGETGNKYAVYLHRFHRSDADEMHDHPWPFISIILSGGYWEKTPDKGWKNGDGPTRLRWYGPGRILVRPAKWIHSVIVPDGQEVTTLILRGQKEKSWGFFCPGSGYIRWTDHLKNATETQEGCPGIKKEAPSV